MTVGTQGPRLVLGGLGGDKGTKMSTRQRASFVSDNSAPLWYASHRCLATPYRSSLALSLSSIEHHSEHLHLL